MLTAYRRHLKICVHRDKGQTYTLCRCPIWCYGTIHGATIRQTLRTTDAAAALREIARIERDGLDTPAQCPTVPDAVKLFLAANAGNGLKASTLESYTKTLAHLSAFFPARADTVDTAALDSYRASRPIQPSTWRKELETIRAFFHFCVAREWVTRNPASRLKMPRTEDLKTQPLGPEQIQKLLQACAVITTDNPALLDYVRRRARALVLILLYSGLRVSDVARLERSALDGRHLTLRVLKNGVRLKVLLHQSAADALNSLPSSTPRYFFWSGNGELHSVTNNMRVTLNRLGKLAGVTVHPHQFRDTFAVELLTNGADIRTVQKLLGHTGVRTTEKHYAHFVAAHQALLDSATSTLDFERPGRPLLVKPLHNRKRNA